MFERGIHVIGALFSILLIVLVLIQILWIKQVLELEEKAFKNKINTVLEEVSTLLEHRDSDKHLKVLQASSFLYSTSDTSAVDFSTALPFDNKGTIGLIQNKEFYYNTSDTIMGLTDKSQKQYPLRFTLPKGASIKTDANLHQDHFKNLVPVHQQTTYVGDIVKRLIQVDVNETVTDKVDKLFLDSVLKKLLVLNGIGMDYQYLLVDEDHKIALTNDNKLLSNYDLTPFDFKQSLFQNDVLDIHQKLYLKFPNKGSFLYTNVFRLLLLSFFVILAIIALFTIILWSMHRQKKISEIKNDFINNMTHELKTPISTISLAYEALKDSELTHKISRDRYIDMIGEENGRLNLIVQNVLRHALMDKGEFKLELKSLDAHVLIEDVVRKMSLVVQDRQGTITTAFDAQEHVLMLDELHFVNMMANLIDNAVKYCNGLPNIEISTRNQKNDLVIEVKDNGIGIRKEDHKKIFDKLFRVSTGNLHDVKGFGLGLSYVYKIVEKHRGKISLVSKINRGSTFIIKIPIIK